MITTVTGKNQVSIPAVLAQELGLKPGSRIDWHRGAVADQLVCRILPHPVDVATSLQGAGRQHLKPGKLHPLVALHEERDREDPLRKATPQ